MGSFSDSPLLRQIVTELDHPSDAETVAANLRLGAISAAAAFLIWGLSPLYWKLLQQVSPVELLAHRVLWSMVLLALWNTLAHRWRSILAAIRVRANVLALLASTICIANNWFIFIWAVNTDRVLHVSFGYYINPLVSVLLGFVILRERLNRSQAVAVILAVMGVAALTVHAGRLPWISLALALSFGFYGLLRKTMQVDAVTGLSVETMILAPLALAFLVVRFRGEDSTFATSLPTDLLLITAGVVTTIPLLLFTRAARRLPLSTLGVLQYIAPSCHFLLGVALYGEPFTLGHAIAFPCIWIALGIYTFDLRQRLRAVSS